MSKLRPGRTAGAHPLLSSQLAVSQRPAHSPLSSNMATCELTAAALPGARRLMGHCGREKPGRARKALLRCCGWVGVRQSLCQLAIEVSLVRGRVWMLMAARPCCGTPRGSFKRAEMWCLNAVCHASAFYRGLHKILPEHDRGDCFFCLFGRGSAGAGSDWRVEQAGHSRSRS